MIRVFPGAAFISLIMLSGCAGAISQREAQDYADRRLVRYCAAACSNFHFVKAQRVKGRWLLDYDPPRHKLMVAVDDGGNTKVSVWDKAP